MSLSVAAWPHHLATGVRCSKRVCVNCAASAMPPDSSRLACSYCSYCQAAADCAGLAHVLDSAPAACKTSRALAKSQHGRAVPACTVCRVVSSGGNDAIPCARALARHACVTHRCTFTLSCWCSDPCHSPANKYPSLPNGSAPAGPGHLRGPDARQAAGELPVGGPHNAQQGVLSSAVGCACTCFSCDLHSNCLALVAAPLVPSEQTHVCPHPT